MVEHLLPKAPFWQYVRFKPDVSAEPDNINEGKGVGYLNEKCEVCSLSL